MISQDMPISQNEMIADVIIGALREESARMRTALQEIVALCESRQERCSPMNEYNTGYYHALELVIEDLKDAMAKPPARCPQCPGTGVTKHGEQCEWCFRMTALSAAEQLDNSTHKP